MQIRASALTDRPSKVCVSPWLHQLHMPNSSSCGQIANYPCANLSVSWTRTTSAPFEPSFKFGNWSVVCEQGACRALGHVAINANPQYQITSVTVSSSIAWCSRQQLQNHREWVPQWVEAGQASWLSVFDQALQTTPTQHCTACLHACSVGEHIGSTICYQPTLSRRFQRGASGTHERES